MKMFKRAAALMLAVMMIVSFTVVASAATVTGSITINKSSTVDIAKKTFNAYKVMDATMADPADTSRVSYTIPAEMEDFYALRYCETPGDSTSAEAFKQTADFKDKVFEGIRNESDKYAFARDVLAAAKTAGVVPASKTAGDAAESVVIDNLPLGYYVIEDASNIIPVSAVMLDTAGNCEITMKADVPFVDKKIGDQAENTAAIGDTVPFTVTTTVPDMDAYTEYYFYLTDTMSKGLTYDSAKGVTVTIRDQGVNPTTTTVDASKYTVKAVTAPDTGITTLEVVFKDFKTDFEANVHDVITITYQAKVNENAVIGNLGNSNKAVINHSNNPGKIPEEDPDNPGKPDPDDPIKPEDAMGATPSSETKTFVTGIQINKTDAGTPALPLAGAEFELAGTALNTVLVKNDEFVVDGEGTYYKLKNGTYTTDAPSGNEDLYDNPTTKYKLTVKSTTINDAAEVHYTGITGADGVLRFDGLAAGEYTLTETKAPAGYNKLEAPITFKIEWDGAANTFKVTNVSTGSSMSAPDGVISTTIVNQTGSILPSTGGMGTTIFYVIGTMLIMMSGVILITRKRVNNI